MLDIVLSAGMALAGGYGTLAAGLFLFQRRILYRPDNARPDLARAGLNGVREITVRTEDGLDLLAWYAPPAAEDGDVVLYLHGNAGNIGHRAARLPGLTANGWGVLMLEYRGFGGNPGRPHEAGFARDARAGLAMLRQMGFTPGRILVWGESLGTGVAVRLVAETPVAALLLEAPFTSITDVARSRYRFIPVRRLLHDHYDSHGRIAHLTTPVLVMHGRHDHIVPVAMGRALHASARMPKELWIADHAGHVDLHEAGAGAVAGRFVRGLKGSA